MKRITLIVSMLLMLGGCAYVQKQVDYAKLCQQDATCLSSAKSDAAMVQSVVGVAYPMASGAAGALVLAISLWIRGRKKEPK
jgi:uncharacterized lipoprotein YmbA